MKIEVYFKNILKISKYTLTYQEKLYKLIIVIVINIKIMRREYGWQY